MNLENDGGESCEWIVTGMDCASCATKIRTAVGKLPGVSNVSVSVMSEKLRLTLDPAEGGAGRNEVEAVVKALGYGVGPNSGRKPIVLPEKHFGHDHSRGNGDGRTPRHVHTRAQERNDLDGGHGSPGHVHDDPAELGQSWFQTAKGRLLVLTALLLALAWGVEHWLAGPIGSWAFMAACVIGVAPVARRALAALRTGQAFTIESLMTIAAVGALFIGAAEEAALVVFLFAVGEVLEGFAANKARSGIRALASLVPTTALLDEGGTTREVSAESLAVGQTVLVRPGDSIPADGEIVEGSSGVDESPVTGESVPRTLGPGDQVFAGSINTEAVLRIRVAKAAKDNTISRIIQLVEDADEARAPTDRFIDRFSRWYMPLIVALAAAVVLLPPLMLGGAWDTWIYRGLALLLIGCPCALVISVPASIASAMASGARHGLLMKGGAVIEAASRVTQVAFDKTGTLTHGRPVVTDIVPLMGDEGSVLRLAAAVETGSSHPLAQAILRKADGIMLPPASDARAIVGKGVRAVVDGRGLTVASPRFASEQQALTEEGLRRAREMEDSGKSVIVLFEGRTTLGLIALRDEPRPDAAEAMRQLRAMGLVPTILTGDNPRTAAAVAGILGADFRAEMLPEDKLAAIRAMTAQGGVMMVGDGINDAPALKQADVGVAMGSGTDVALETADAAILRDRVTDVAATIRLARATMANIRQNVALALGLKAVFLVTSILGMTGLWLAIMADTGATVLVTLNALRLLAFKPERSG